MKLTLKISKIILTCGTVLFLAAPLLAGNGPGDGTGNGGDGPEDGIGNGPGDCSTSIQQSNDLLLLAGNGNQGSGDNGGSGPGDGTGNGGDGPGDGTGNGPGDC